MTDTTYDNSTELDPRIAARLKRDATGKRSCFLEGGPLPVVEGHRPAEQ